MYLRKVLNTERLSSEIREYLTIVGRGFKHFSPDLIRIGYFYLSDKRIDSNNFFHTDEDIIIRIHYQLVSFDCYLSMKNLSIGNIPFGDLMYRFASEMRRLEEQKQEKED